MAFWNRYFPEGNYKVVSPEEYKDMQDSACLNPIGIFRQGSDFKRIWEARDRLNDTVLHKNYLSRAEVYEKFFKGAAGGPTLPTRIVRDQVVAQALREKRHGATSKTSTTAAVSCTSTSKSDRTKGSRRMNRESGQAPCKKDPSMKPSAPPPKDKAVPPKRETVASMGHEASLKVERKPRV